MRVNEILSELHGIKGDLARIGPGAMSPAWEKLLAKHGFKPIGVGMHGQVYLNPKFPYVLKVFRSQDISYQAWVKACKGPLLGNPYVPVFRGGLVRLTPDAKATRMELLTTATGEQQGFAKWLDNFLSMAVAKKLPDWTKLKPEIVNHMDENLIAVINQIYEIVTTQKGIAIDLTEENVMSRSGQLVFIDPLG